MSMPIYGSIIALQILSIIIMLFFFRKIAQIIVLATEKLSQDTANALQTTVTQLLEGNFDLPDREPANPMQQLLATYMQNKMNPTIEVTEVQTRNADGTYS